MVLSPAEMQEDLTHGGPTHAMVSEGREGSLKFQVAHALRVQHCAGLG